MIIPIIIIVTSESLPRSLSNMYIYLYKRKLRLGLPELKVGQALALIFGELRACPTPSLSAGPLVSLPVGSHTFRHTHICLPLSLSLSLKHVYISIQKEVAARTSGELRASPTPSLSYIWRAEGLPQRPRSLQALWFPCLWVHILVLMTRRQIIIIIIIIIIVARWCEGGAAPAAHSRGFLSGAADPEVFVRRQTPYYIRHSGFGPCFRVEGRWQAAPTHSDSYHIVTKRERWQAGMQACCRSSPCD